MASGKTSKRTVHSLIANAGKGFVWDNSLKGFAANVQNLASCLHPAVLHGRLADALSRIALSASSTSLPHGAGLLKTQP